MIYCTAAYNSICIQFNYKFSLNFASCNILLANTENIGKYSVSDVTRGINILLPYNFHETHSYISNQKANVLPVISQTWFATAFLIYFHPILWFYLQKQIKLIEKTLHVRWKTFMKFLFNKILLFSHGKGRKFLLDRVSPGKLWKLLKVDLKSSNPTWGLLPHTWDKIIYSGKISMWDQCDRNR